MSKVTQAARVSATAPHVVLGTGPLGLSVARHLASRGERVRVVNRAGRADVPAHVDIVAADLMDRAAMAEVCDGAKVLYHCANPPYARWPELHPPLMDAVIDGAPRSAKLVFGDNLYAYGPVDGPLTEDLPQQATGPNGRTRARIARALMAAHEAGQVRASIGRGSDFFGPHARESTVGERVFGRATKGQPAQLLGDPDVPHTVTYIDDFGRALVTLGADERADGRVWHVPCPETVTMRRFVEMVFRAAGAAPRLRAAPRWGLALASVLNPTLRAVREQLYQSERPWVVDSTAFEQEFGWRATPLEDAIGETVRWFRQSA